MPVLSPGELAPHFPQLEIISFLGRGGMGVVYKARQKSLNRLVALKLLAPECAKDSQFSARFEKEAHALAALNHPNIVAVHDFGLAGGFYFLLMEFVDGVNLRQLMEAKKLSPKEALSIVPPICDALQCAHDHGIVHRDIKPENILIDKTGSVKIADFGIAKMVARHSNVEDRESDNPTSESQTTPGLGTPEYAAPEQNQASVATDHRVDIYSLGVVLYEMLTGERPKDNMVPPSKRVQMDVRIDEIVLRALEKTPELRFATAADFRTQVETVVGSSPEVVTAKSSRISLTAIAGFCLWLFSFVAWAFAAAFIFSMARRQVPSDDSLSVMPWWAHASTVVALIPVVLGPMLATLLGWIAVGKIHRSAGRLCGMPLALFDALLLPVLVTLALMIGLCRWLLRVLATSVIDHGHEETSWWERVLVLHPAGLALFALFVAGMLVTFFGVRYIWRVAKVSAGDTPLEKPSHLGSEASLPRTLVPRWVTVSAFAFCVIVLVIINVRSWPAPLGSWTADLISNGPPINSDVTVQVEKVLQRDQCLWVLLRSSSAGQSLRIRSRFSAVLSRQPSVAPAPVPEGPPVSQAVLLSLTPEKPPHESFLSSRDVPDISGPGLAWIGYAMPSSEAAAVAVKQITELHLNRPQGITRELSALLLFHLTARATRPNPDERLIGDLFFDIEPRVSTQAMDASGAKVEMSRVIELLLLDPKVGAGCVLDFETGRFLTPPRDLAEKLAQGNAEIGAEAARWLRDSGADAAVRMPDGGALRLFEGIALSGSPNPGRPLSWEEFTDADVISTLGAATFEQQQRLVNNERTFYATPATSPTALAFMTREGSMGVMEVLGRDARGPGMRIRYRLTRSVSTAPPSIGNKDNR